MIEKQPFDSTRLEVIQTVARSGRFTTEEAAALASLLTFDSNRQDALIALYPAVTDPGRFVMALDILTYRSSRRQVTEALGL